MNYPTSRESEENVIKRLDFVNENENTIVDSKLKEEVEILRERLKNFELKKNNILHSEKIIKELRQKLDEKDSVIEKFQIFHKDLMQKNLLTVKEITDENYKLKDIISDLTSAYKNEDEIALRTILNYLVENQQEFENKYLLQIKEDQSFQLNLIKVNDQTNEKYEKEYLDDNQKEDKFSEKVIGEFDKLFTGEYKRLERHFKVEPKKKMNSSVSGSTSQKSLRSSSSGKNYIEWNAKNTNLTWVEMLRGNPKKHVIQKYDVIELAKECKEKIRNSMKNRYESFKNNSEDETTQRMCMQKSISQSPNKLGMSQSLSRIDSIKKFAKKEDSYRERIEGNLRKVLFKYKQK